MPFPYARPTRGPSLPLSLVKVVQRQLKRDFASFLLTHFPFQLQFVGREYRMPTDNSLTASSRTESVLERQFFFFSVLVTRLEPLWKNNSLYSYIKPSHSVAALFIS